MCCIGDGLLCYCGGFGCCDVGYFCGLIVEYLDFFGYCGEFVVV